MEKQTSLVFMLAGLSSRFGGKIKGMERVGPNGESLLEQSILQALTSPFSKIIFIVSKDTEPILKKEFGNSYKGVPIKYALQSFDEKERDKPWGTTDAICSAKNIILEPFIVCNGDDLYGPSSFKRIFDHLKSSSDAVTVGYPLSKVLPKEGMTNRGIFQERGGFVTGIKETFGISSQNFRELGLTEESLCSMNLFGLQPEDLAFLKKSLDKFKENHKGDRKSECLLPVEISNLVKEGKIKMKIYPTKDNWIGITNPGDEEAVKEYLSKTLKTDYSQK